MVVLKVSWCGIMPGGDRVEPVEQRGERQGLAEGESVIERQSLSRRARKQL
jgi:hypothetical protein